MAPEHFKVAFSALSPSDTDTQPWVEAYAQQRKVLMSQFYDQAFTPAIESEIGWSTDEQRVNEQLQLLRHQVVSQPGYYDRPLEAEYFINVKQQIEDTALFAFLQQLPKGAILHIHPSAMGDYRRLVEKAAAYQENGKQFYINYQRAEDHPRELFLLAAQSPNGYLSLRDEWLANPEKIMALLTMTPRDSHYDGDAWDNFEPVFSRVGALLNIPTLAEDYYYHAFLYLVATDHLCHLELRTPWLVANEQKENSREGVILKAFKRVQKDYPHFSIKVIYSDSRHIRKEWSAKILSDIIAVGQAIKANPNGMLTGYDLVGEEDTGKTTRYFIGDLFSAYNELGHYLPPFYFHDGESDLPPDYRGYDNQQDNPARIYFNNNMVDAYMVNTLRIDHFTQQPARVGHGLALFKTPQTVAGLQSLWPGR